MSTDFTTLWRGLTVGLALPDRAFGAAVDIDGLLVEPDLHFAATATTSRLLLMPRAGSFLRLLLEWETLPEIGAFTASALGPDPFDESELGRLETWMRDVAVVLHEHRDRIREASERVVRDAAEGLDRSVPPETRVVGERVHVVSAQIGTRVAGPDASRGVVDATTSATNPDETTFVARSTGERLGRRITTRQGDEVVSVDLEPWADGVTRDDLAAWYDQHIFREVLFDDVWQVYVHLVAGLDAPANVTYFGG